MKRKLKVVFVLFVFLSIVITSVHAGLIETRDSHLLDNGVTIFVDDDNIDGPWNGTHGFGDFDDWQHLDFSFFKTVILNGQNKQCT